MAIRRRLWLWGVAGISLATLVLLLLWRQPSLNSGFVFGYVNVPGDGDRHYRLDVPKRLEGEKLPLIIAFHGVGDGPDAMPEYSRLGDLAGRHGILLAYPQATNGMWNLAQEGAESSISPNDLLFFDELLCRLTTENELQINVDPQRIYVVGMSNGASFARRLAIERPSSIAAVVAHSGSDPGPTDLADTVPVPTLYVVGAEDAQLLIDAMRADVERIQSQGGTARLIVVPNLGHAWTTDFNEEMWQFLSQYDLRTGKPEGR